jgi:hypothetical protein
MRKKNIRKKNLQSHRPESGSGPDFRKPGHTFYVC